MNTARLALGRQPRTGSWPTASNCSASPHRSRCERAPRRPQACRAVAGPRSARPSHQPEASVNSHRRCGRATRLAATTAKYPGGVKVSELAEKYGTPLFVIDEDDFRSRCRDMAARVRPEAGAYASKAFLCGEIARWVCRRRSVARRLLRRRLASRCSRIPGRANCHARQQQVGRRTDRWCAPASGTSSRLARSRSTDSTRRR